MKQFNILLISLLLSFNVHAGTKIQGPALIEGFTTTATAAGTTTLTKNSETKQIFTGTSTQTVTLPSALTLPLGRKFLIINKSSGAVTVNDNGGTMVAYVFGNGEVEIHLRVAGSAAGTWDAVNRSVGSGAIITAWQSYTPTFTGLGTVTSIEFQWRRVGSNIQIQGKATSGTATAVEARMSLPDSLTSAGTSLIPSIRLVGYLQQAVADGNQNGILIEPSTAYITFSQQGGSTAGVTKKNGSNIFNNGVAFSLFAEFPISSWESTGTTFNIDCGVTGTCLNDFSFQISSGGVVSGENVDFVNGNCSGSAGSLNYQFVCTWNTNFFTVAPNCLVSSSAPSGVTAAISSLTTSSGTFTTESGGAPTANGMIVNCQRRGTDRRPAINAPLINNSVTSSSSGLERTNRVYGRCSTSASIFDQSGAGITTGNISSGCCALTAPSGVWSSNPTCVSSLSNNAASSTVVIGQFSTATTGTVCAGTGGTTQFDYNLICMGPR